MSRPEPSLIVQKEGMGTQMGADELERELSGTCGPEHWPHPTPASAKQPAHQG